MTTMPNHEFGLGADLFLDRTTLACREIGQLVAQIENSIIDSATEVGRPKIPRQTLQRIDLVIQSMEELACMFERARAEHHAFRNINVEAVVSPGKLEWLRTLISEGTMAEITSPKTDDISLF